MQAALSDGPFLDLFPFSQNGVVAAEVDVSRCDVVQALVVSFAVVVIDEGADLAFEVAGQVIVFRQDTVLHGLMPAFDFTYAAVERYNFTLSEAAADLYASKFVTLRRVLLPAIKPGVIGGCILVFVPSLGSFLAPDLLGGAKNYMIGSLIEEQFKGNAGNWPFGAAAAMVLLTMVLIVLILFARSRSKREKGAE